MLKSYTLIILAVIVVVSVAACSNDETAEPTAVVPISIAEETIDILQVDNEFCAGTFRVDTGFYWRLGTSGDLVIWKDTENLRAYNIASDIQFDLTDKLGDGSPSVAIDGPYIIWEEDQEGSNALHGYYTIEETHFPVATGSNCALPFVRGNIAVWSCCETGMGCDIYGLNLQTKEEFPVCVREGNQLPIGISSDAVIYWDETEDAWDLYAWDLKSGNEFLILTREDRLPPKSIVVGSNIVAWVEKHELIRLYNAVRSVTSDPSNLFGFDLNTREQFEICTKPDQQVLVGIAGDIVIWEDYRYVTEKEVPLVEPRRPFDLMLGGIYGYEFSKGEEFVIATGNVISNTTSVSKDMVVWKDVRDSSLNDVSPEIYAYDLTNKLEYSIGRTNIFNWGPTWGDQTVVGDNTIAWIGLDDNKPIDIKTDCWTVCGAVLSHRQSSISELPTTTPSDSSVFSDPRLDALVRDAIEKPVGAITPADCVQLTVLEFSDWDLGLWDITGIQHCINLTELDLSLNYLTDITHLTNLTNLTKLDLSSNLITDISPLSDLTNLTELMLFDNEITDISPLVENSGLSEGSEVNLRGNPLSDTSLNFTIPQLEERGVRVNH